MSLIPENADSDNDAPTVAYVIECPCVCVEDHGGSGDDQHQTDGSDGKADDDGCPFRDTASDDCSDDSRDWEYQTKRNEGDPRNTGGESWEYVTHQ